MSMSLAPDSAEWSQSKWAAAIGLVFAGQLALVFLTSSQSLASRAALDRQSVLRVTTYQTAPDSAATTWSDPMLLVAANPDGFSGRVWRELKLPDHRYHQWTEPAPWLSPSVGRFGSSGADLDHRVTDPGFRIATKPEPGLTVPRMAPDPVPTSSAWELRGELANRPLRMAVSVPSWPALNVLTNTVIESLVSAEGHTLSARVISSSGSREADAFAQNLVRTVRFAPVTPAQASVDLAGSVTFGEWVFRWHIVPPPAPPATGGTVP